ncbi:MAG TPA: TIGR01777 family oxidoreductase, partial [Polyangia bacterium]
RWTPARKRELRDSRVSSTSLLASAIAACRRRPRVLVSASAVGWYGARAGVVDESAARGDGFLAELCAEWEAAADPARAAGVRVAHPRLGIVLARQGGALAKMLPLFRLGLGAVPGDGTAPLSGVALDDAVAALRFAIEQEALAGALNVTSPEPTTQRGLAVALGRALHRPVLLSLPAGLLRLAVGELAESLLAGAAVVPTRLVAAGFSFAYPALPDALDHALAVDSGS